LTRLTFVQSTFSKRFGDKGINFYEILVFDLLHVFELGVWKAVFTNLIRMLYSRGKKYVDELNKRCAFECIHKLAS
jgi:hypothetical protein